MRHPSSPLLFCLFLLLILMLRTGTASAQDAASSLPIGYGQDVSDSITSDAFFDHWQLNAAAHDRLYVRMSASGGLRPLVGILSAGGALLARSDDGEANGTVDLSFEIPETGLYIIVATRVDNERGTTEGAYTLRVDNLTAQPTPNPLYGEVSFVCGTTDATAVASVHFARDDGDNGAYSLRVYGLDGFQPVIRVQSNGDEACITTPADALGDVLTLPGEPAITITQDLLAHTAQYVITAENTPSQSAITVTIGSLDGATGRFAAIIGGFAIEPADDLDVMEVRLAPRPAAANAPLLVYVIGDGRLDPSVITETRCDDAGRRGCEAIPSAAGAGVTFNKGAQVVGDRFDAGAQIADIAPHSLQILSFSGSTRGGYALFLFGALPATDS